MALIIENGTLVANANSYVSIAEADAYWTARNVVDWAGAGASNAVKEGFLLQAADWLNTVPAWIGSATDVEQTMALPTLLTGILTIPWPVKQAQIILAKEAKDQGGLGTPMGTARIKSERKKLEGVGEKEVHYVDGAPSIRIADSLVLGLLRPYTVTGGIQQARVDYS